jgi:peptide/nickel transport system substrate-binding protein
MGGYAMSARAISRRELLLWLGSAVAGIGLATACAPIGSPTAAVPTAANPPVTGAQAKTGGTLIIGQLSPILNTVPYPSGPANGTFRWAIFSPLVSLDQNKQPIPAMAESWTFSDDQLTLTFKLRKGVTFHSGRPFTADEAKWSIEFVQDPQTAAQSGAELKAVHVRVVDAATLELRLPDVMPHIFSLLTDVMMIDPQSDVTLNASGTGPFKFEGLTSGAEMHLVRNQQYWRSGRPYLDAVTIKTLPDPSSAIVNLKSGAVSLVQIRASDVQQMKSEAGTTVVVVPATGSYEMLISTVDPPFTDKRVRQVIDLALDRKRFSESLLYGVADPTYIMWPKASPAWDASLDVGEFNVDKAKELLIAAGYPNGFETRIQASTAYPEEVQFDQIIQSDLARIGITASIEPLDPTQAMTLLAQGKFSALLSFVYGLADADPAQAFTAFPFRPSGNASRFKSDEYTQLVDSARREPDFQKRLALYRHIAGFMKDQAFVLPLANFVGLWGMRANVQGFSRQPLYNSPALEDVWLA